MIHPVLPPLRASLVALVVSFTVFLDALIASSCLCACRNPPAVVMFFRFVTSAEVQRRADFFEPFIFGLTNLDVKKVSRVMTLSLPKPGCLLGHMFGQTLLARLHWSSDLRNDSIATQCCCPQEFQSIEGKACHIHKLFDCQLLVEPPFIRQRVLSHVFEV